MGRRTPLAVTAAVLAMTPGWRLARGSVTWRRIQVLHVPVQYGSSG